ncbi:MAG: type 1 glutamine amidotransferase [Bdellovibrionales bacterium]|nr:type 1 glutamine amidotransferase [Bdellovibrionales bacterium]
MLLKGKRIAIVVTNGFEESELYQPRKALEATGAETEIISLDTGAIRRWSSRNSGEKLKGDLDIDSTAAEHYDALLLPGGVYNPDTLRQSPSVLAFIQHFFESAIPVAAICHAPQVLIEAEVVRDREHTSYPSIKTDLVNAGARWRDKPVVVDNGLVTSRSPKDLPVFCSKIVEEFAEGRHAQHVA